jgi:hypothetical protein
LPIFLKTNDMIILSAYVNCCIFYPIIFQSYFVL